MTIRVLIVDDSPTMRALLLRLLASDPEIEVVGAAACAAEARIMIKECNPDVITLDIEMPGMDGLQLLDKIMRLRPMPVVIVSSLTSGACDTTIRALELGALDCYPKPRGVSRALLDGRDNALVTIVKDAANASCCQFPPAFRASQPRRPIGAARADKTRLIAIAASTGGVEALHHLLPAFPDNCPPTLVVQHISAGFAPALAKRLGLQCRAKVQLAEPGLALQSGHVYIAPGNNRHMILKGGDKLHVGSVRGDPVEGHCPSADALFHSVAKILGRSAVGILLTGMGADGASGLLAMRRAGGRTIAQNEATSVIYGMPRAAAKLGAVEMMLPLSRIAEYALLDMPGSPEAQPEPDHCDVQLAGAIRG